MKESVKELVETVQRHDKAIELLKDIRESNLIPHTPDNQWDSHEHCTLCRIDNLLNQAMK